MAQTQPSKAHILSLPYEIRKEILTQALLSEILSYKLPYGDSTLAFDKPLRPIFTPQALKGTWGIEKRHWNGGPGFWEAERMTVLMRVNKQFHDEVSAIMWEDWAVYWSPKSVMGQVRWEKWVTKCNPGVREKVRHLQIRVMETVQSSKPRREKWYKRWREEARQEIAFYPNLRSVRIQVFIWPTGRKTVTEKKKKLVVERLMKIVGFCEGLKVLVFYEPDYRVDWGEGIVKEVQDRIGQTVRSTPLYRELLDSFPESATGGVIDSDKSGSDSDDY